MEELKCAALQLNTSADLAANLTRCAALIERAAERGARLLVLPETFAFMGKSLKAQRDVAEPLGRGRIQDFLAECAARHRVYIVGGTVPTRVADEARVYATSSFYDDRGERIADYHKIHLFDVDLPAKGESYRESSVFKAGSKAVVVETPLGRVFSRAAQ